MHNNIGQLIINLKQLYRQQINTNSYLQLFINSRKSAKIQRMDNCTIDCIMIQGNLNYTEMCTFTRDQCIQDTVQFVQAYYCLLHGSFMILFFIGIPLFFLLLKTSHVIASNYLSQCVQEFISEFKISPTLAGVTFLAFANGSNDIVTAIVAGSSDSNSTSLIPFGSIFGACLFSTAIIFSTIILKLPNQTLTVNIKQVTLPVSIYVIGMVFLIAVTVFYGKMNIILASVLLVLYLIFIVIVLKSERNTRKKQSLLMSATSEQQIPKQSVQLQKMAGLNDSLQLKGQDESQQKMGFIDKLGQNVQKIQILVLQRIIPPFRAQKWSPVNTVVSIVISPFILAATQQMPQVFKLFIGPIPVFLLMSLPAIALLSYTIYCVVRQQQPYFIKPFTIYSFFVCIAALTIVCSILINFMELVQILTGVNPVFLGLTVFAWANSIGDYFTVTHFAKSGNSATSVAGIFSAQLFNFLLGFGISLVIQSSKGEYEYKIFDFVGSTYDKISDAIVVIVIFGGILYLCFILVTVILNKGVFMRKQAKISRWYYAGFLLVACFLSVLTDFFNQIQCNME